MTLLRFREKREGRENSLDGRGLRESPGLFTTQENVVCGGCESVLKCEGLNADYWLCVDLQVFSFFLLTGATFIYLFLTFYWSIIALQWCVSFCFITK